MSMIDDSFELIRQLKTRKLLSLIKLIVKP